MNGLWCGAYRWVVGRASQDISQSTTAVRSIYSQFVRREEMSASYIHTRYALS